jgi:4-hydroxy-3-methylbut-2-en-1-yl diphosphate synthase IspG/GcpE
MVESAARHIHLLEDEGYREIKVSLKAHDVAMTVRANRLFAQRFDYPLHLGITEAGTLLSGAVKSAAGMGILLADGIGDTIRVSLAADPLEEVKVARILLKALGLKFGGATLTACPTCGRCDVAMIPIAERVEQRLSQLKGEVNVAVMGCEVNGPGEASAADVGVAYGHNGVGLLFKNGKIVKRMKAEELEDALVEEAGEEVGTSLFRRYADAFPAGYRDDRVARSAVADIRQIEALGREPALLGLGIEDGHDVDVALAAQPLDQVHVRRPEDASAADHAQADAHVVLLAVS